MSAKPAGRVILVGAGPGDPELLTLRGAAALAEADVVVYDALAPSELLTRVRPDAERINVGKRGHDAPTRSQEEIQALLVQHAREGRVVVRLKGGDPFVFGRGGEEASALVAAGIDVEVVPGVSSAIGALAYAGIPVTDRRYAASFAVVTGHKDPSLPRESLRWEALAHGADTLVILMGMRNLPELVRRVLAGGRAPETPAAAVMLGTTPRQRVVEAPLAELPAAVAEAGLGAPSVVVVGDVVRLRRELAWYERRPLFGRRILVTRTEGRAGAFAGALRAAGAEPVLCPLIRTEPVSAGGEGRRLLAALAGYDAVLLTSANAARGLRREADAAGVSLAGTRALCVGPASAEAAREAGLDVAPLPARAPHAEALLQAMRAHLPTAGRRFLFPCAEGARAVLPEGLRAAGAHVDRLVVYRTVPAAVDAAALRAALEAGEFDTLTFASPSAVRAFCALLDAPARAAAGRALRAALGPVTAQALEREGLAPDVTAAEASAEGLVAALVAHRRAGAGAETRREPGAGRSGS